MHYWGEQKIGKRGNILGNDLPNCNPYRPVWAEDKEMSPDQRASRRTVHHIKNLTEQWFKCATEERNEDIKAF